MHFFEFLQLNEDEQIELLWYNGEQIGTRKEGDFLMLLYQVEGFYVEVYYNTKERTIKRYLCFECTDLLDPYINNIDLSPVYKYLNKKAKNREVHLVSFGDNETDKLFSKKGTSRKFNQNRTITNFMSGIFNALFSKTSKKQL